MYNSLKRTGLAATIAASTLLSACGTVNDVALDIFDSVSKQKDPYWEQAESLGKNRLGVKYVEQCNNQPEEVPTPYPALRCERTIEEYVTNLNTGEKITTHSNDLNTIWEYDMSTKEYTVTSERIVLDGETCAWRREDGKNEMIQEDCLPVTVELEEYLGPKSVYVDRHKPPIEQVDIDRLRDAGRPTKEAIKDLKRSIRKYILTHAQQRWSEDWKPRLNINIGDILADVIDDDECGSVLECRQVVDSIIDNYEKDVHGFYQLSPSDRIQYRQKLLDEVLERNNVRDGKEEDGSFFETTRFGISPTHNQFKVTMRNVFEAGDKVTLRVRYDALDLRTKSYEALYQQRFPIEDWGIEEWGVGFKFKDKNNKENEDVYLGVAYMKGDLVSNIVDVTLGNLINALFVIPFDTSLRPIVERGPNYINPRKHWGAWKPLD